MQTTSFNSSKPASAHCNQVASGLHKKLQFVFVVTVLLLRAEAV